MPAAFRPLRHRNFAILWSAGLVSNIGSWLQNVAVGALVQGLTGRTVWSVATYIASFLPMGLLAPVGGALADRVDRRKGAILFVSLEAVVASALAIAVAAGKTHPVVVTTLVFAGGCVGAIRLPFQQSMLPDLVPAEDIVAAVSLSSAQWNLGRVVGPALAGVVIIVGSFQLAFALNAVSFLAVVAAFVFIRLPARPASATNASLLSHMREGGRMARETPAVRAAIILIALAAATVAPFMALVPAMADSLVDGGPEALAGPTGALTTAQGLGAVLGAVLFPSLVERFGRRRMLLAVLIAAPVAVIPYALAPSVPAAAVGIFFVGATYICILSGLSAVVQLRAPSAFRGRVLSLYFATLSLVFPIGALLQGAVAERIGIPATAITGAAVLLGTIGLLALFRPLVLRVLDLDAHTPPPEPLLGTASGAPAPVAVPKSGEGASRGAAD